MTLRFLTSGESHGPCLTVIVDGLPAGLSLAESDLAVDMARRQGGYGRGARMTKIEQDRAEILGGVANGETTGAPVALRIENADWPNWKDRKVKPITSTRPGHADWAGGIKYGHEDFRTVLERASARETAARVAVGAICKRLLAEVGTSVHSQVIRIGTVRAEPATDLTPEVVERVEASPFRCADPAAEAAMRALVDDAKKRGDTLGGVFEVRATGVVPGLGSYAQWDRKLDGLLAQAVMSIHAIKGVEIGDGFAEAERFGTQAHDAFEIGAGGVVGRATNRAGGTEGGVTNGQPVVVRAAMKPISSTISPQRTVDFATGRAVPTQYQRSDVCAVPAAAVVGEAMVAIVLAQALLDKFGGDTVRDVRASVEAYLAASAYWLRAEEREGEQV
jgi:chorismate synthase